MSKKIITVVLLVIVGVSAYRIGWSRGLTLGRVSSAHYHGSVDLGAAMRLREGDSVTALHLLEISFQGDFNLLTANKESWASSVDDYDRKFVDAVEKYRTEFPESKKLTPPVAQNG